MGADLVELAHIITGTDALAGVMGHDIGAMVAFAMAAQSDAIETLTLVDAPIPGTATWDIVASSPKIWHFGFHRTGALAARLVQGNERLYIEEFVRARIGRADAIDHDDIDRYAVEYQRPGAMRAAFACYQTFDEDADRNRAVLKRRLL